MSGTVVIGGGGFIGEHVVEELTERAYLLRGLDEPSLETHQG